MKTTTNAMLVHLEERIELSKDELYASNFNLGDMSLDRLHIIFDDFEHKIVRFKKNTEKPFAVIKFADKKEMRRALKETIFFTSYGLMSLYRYKKTVQRFVIEINFRIKTATTDDDEELKSELERIEEILKESKGFVKCGLQVKHSQSLKIVQDLWDRRNLYGRAEGAILLAEFDMDCDSFKMNVKEILEKIIRLEKQISRAGVDSNISIDLKRFKHHINGSISSTSTLTSTDSATTTTPYRTIYVENIKFGNLATPNEFHCSSDSYLNNLEFKPNEIVLDIDVTKRLLIIDFLTDGIARYEIPFQFVVDRVLFINDQTFGAYHQTFELIIQLNNIQLIKLADSTENYKHIEKWLKLIEHANERDLNRLLKRQPRDYREHWEHTLKLRIHTRFRYSLIDRLSTTRSLRCIFANINTYEANYTLNDFRRDLKLKSFNSRYYIECLISQHGKNFMGRTDSSFTKRINELDESDSLSLFPRVVENLSNRMSNLGERFRANLLDLLEISIKEEKNLDKSVLEAIKPQNSSDSALIKRAFITPSRIVYFFPQMSQSNRVIREFGHENFLSVRILDDNLQPLNPQMNYEMVFDKLRKILLNGIDCGGKRFEFLAMSSSQMREHGCWFYGQQQQQQIKQTNQLITAKTIREWMGDFSSIKTIGKYIARLGQSLSSSVESIHLEHQIIPDIFTKDRKYNFTDGIGRISRTKALTIQRHLGLDKCPSAFQIRYAGFKGVIAAHPDNEINFIKYNNMNIDLQLRNSMKKFDSTHSKLDILSYSRYMPCHLNRQVIQILDSLGIEDHVIEMFQDRMIRKLFDVLLDKRALNDFLNNTYRRKSFYNKTPDVRETHEYLDTECWIDFRYEPFFRDYVLHTQQMQADGMVKKSRIEIENGRLLMGVVDEFDILNEDEVFIQCSSSKLRNSFNPTGEEMISKEYISSVAAAAAAATGALSSSSKSNLFVLDCKVIVTKNPCMHPGDMRLLKAVYKRELMHLVDCIVFPRKGKRPIPNMCAGSDLDGDLYWVAWDKNLIPSQTAMNKMSKPLDYETTSAETPVETKNINIMNVVDFFIDFIKDNQLGLITNKHIAIADQSSKGILDPDCITLAKLFSKAVDFPKTGIKVEIPKEISCRKISYPDYLEKDSSNGSISTHVSEKIIGKLYRKSKSIFFNRRQLIINDIVKKYEPVPMDRSLLFQGYEKYLTKASELYLNYRTSLEKIMDHFDVKNEIQLLSGLIDSRNNKKCDSIIKNQQKEFQQMSQKKVTDLWQLMRAKFNKIIQIDNKGYFIEHHHLNKLRLASAWYYACYSSELNESKRILSFPWIVEDLLYECHCKNQTSINYGQPAALTDSAFNKNEKLRQDYLASDRFRQRAENKCIAYLDDVQKLTKLMRVRKLYLISQLCFVPSVKSNKKLHRTDLVCLDPSIRNPTRFMNLLMTRLEKTEFIGNFLLDRKLPDRKFSVKIVDSDHIITVQFISIKNNNNNNNNLNENENNESDNDFGLIEPSFIINQCFRYAFFKQPFLLLLTHLFVKLIQLDDQMQSDFDDICLYELILNYCLDNGLITKFKESHARLSFESMLSNIDQTNQNNNGADDEDLYDLNGKYLQMLSLGWSDLMQKLKMKSTVNSWPDLMELALKIYRHYSLIYSSQCLIMHMTSPTKKFCLLTINEELTTNVKHHFLKSFLILTRQNGSALMMFDDSSKWEFATRKQFELWNAVENSSKSGDDEEMNEEDENFGIDFLKEYYTKHISSQRTGDSDKRIIHSLFMAVVKD